MTRINLIEPNCLTDQHLFAEFREIKMIAKSLQRSYDSILKKEFAKCKNIDIAIAQTKTILLERIPKVYTLNKGHVTFFYDKGLFLRKRYIQICKELVERGVNFNQNAQLDENHVFQSLDLDFNKDFIPTAIEIEISKERIYTRLTQRPTFYKYKGEPLKLMHL